MNKKGSLIVWIILIVAVIGLLWYTGTGGLLRKAASKVTGSDNPDIAANPPENTLIKECELAENQINIKEICDSVLYRGEHDSWWQRHINDPEIVDLLQKDPKAYQAIKDFCTKLPVDAAGNYPKYYVCSYAGGYLPALIEKDNEPINNFDGYLNGHKIFSLKSKGWTNPPRILGEYGDGLLIQYEFSANGFRNAKGTAKINFFKEEESMRINWNDLTKNESQVLDKFVKNSDGMVEILPTNSSASPIYFYIAPGIQRLTKIRLGPSQMFFLVPALLIIDEKTLNYWKAALPEQEMKVDSTGVLGKTGEVAGNVASKVGILAERGLDKLIEVTGDGTDSKNFKVKVYFSPYNANAGSLIKVTGGECGKTVQCVCTGVNEWRNYVQWGEDTWKEFSSRVKSKKPVKLTSKSNAGECTISLPKMAADKPGEYSVSYNPDNAKYETAIYNVPGNPDSKEIQHVFLYAEDKSKFYGVYYKDYGDAQATVNKIVSFWKVNAPPEKDTPLKWAYDAENKRFLLKGLQKGDNVKVKMVLDLSKITGIAINKLKDLITIVDLKKQLTTEQYQTLTSIYRLPEENKKSISPSSQTIVGILSELKGKITSGKLPNDVSENLGKMGFDIKKVEDLLNAIKETPKEKTFFEYEITLNSNDFEYIEELPKEIALTESEQPLDIPSDLPDDGAIIAEGDPITGPYGENNMNLVEAAFQEIIAKVDGEAADMMPCQKMLTNINTSPEIVKEGEGFQVTGTVVAVGNCNAETISVTLPEIAALETDPSVKPITSQTISLEGSGEVMRDFVLGPYAARGIGTQCFDVSLSDGTAAIGEISVKPNTEYCQKNYGKDDCFEDEYDPGSCGFVDKCDVVDPSLDESGPLEVYYKDPFTEETPGYCEFIDMVSTNIPSFQIEGKFSDTAATEDTAVTAPKAETIYQNNSETAYFGWFSKERKVSPEEEEMIILQAEINKNQKKAVRLKNQLEDLVAGEGLALESDEISGLKQLIKGKTKLNGFESAKLFQDIEVMEKEVDGLLTPFDATGKPRVWTVEVKKELIAKKEQLAKAKTAIKNVLVRHSLLNSKLLKETIEVTGKVIRTYEEALEVLEEAGGTCKKFADGRKKTIAYRIGKKAGFYYAWYKEAKETGKLARFWQGIKESRVVASLRWGKDKIASFRKAPGAKKIPVVSLLLVAPQVYKNLRAEDYSGAADETGRALSFVYDGGRMIQEGGEKIEAAMEKSAKYKEWSIEEVSKMRDLTENEEYTAYGVKIKVNAPQKDCDAMTQEELDAAFDDVVLMLKQLETKENN